jgi:SAM-dependent methyltransferase
MALPSSITERQSLRQRSWLADSWTWLLRTEVLGEEVQGRRPTALDVGCGPGLVMELLSPYLEVQGVDIDAHAVQAANARKQNAVIGRAEDLPFEDGAFDIVYCSFLLLWVLDPVTVVEEMKRVSREWVICLAEPDHGGRVSYPPEVAPLDRWFVEGLRRQGADPIMGRRLQSVLRECSLLPEVGVHSGMWDVNMQEEADAEWRSLAPICSEVANPASLSRVKAAWDSAVRDGELIQFTPTFYALARRGPIGP